MYFEEKEKSINPNLKQMSLEILYVLSPLSN